MTNAEGDEAEVVILIMIAILAPIVIMNEDMTTVVTVEMTAIVAVTKEMLTDLGGLQTVLHCVEMMNITEETIEMTTGDGVESRLHAANTGTTGIDIMMILAVIRDTLSAGARRVARVSARNLTTLIDDHARRAARHDEGVLVLRRVLPGNKSSEQKKYSLYNSCLL